uniref:Uncharacterized protein n=1 Tax=Oryza glumipatula TaxID=40148 RepID=A0A0D9Y7D2_9ORYZ
MAARSLAVPLLLTLCLLAAHLLTVACARHHPPSPPETEGFDVVDTSPTNDGPSPAGGHGNHPSAAVVIPAGGASPGGVSSTESRARGGFISHDMSPCHCRGGGVPVTDAAQHGGRHP